VHVHGVSLVCFPLPGRRHPHWLLQRTCLWEICTRPWENKGPQERMFQAIDGRGGVVRERGKAIFASYYSVPRQLGLVHTGLDCWQGKPRYR
jgi:hypothetical protein